MLFLSIASGFTFLEAPRDDGTSVWFSDAVGGLFRLHRNGKIDAFLAERAAIGGVAINKDGAIIASGRGGLVWLEPVSGAAGTLLDAIEGQSIAGINDIFPDGKGGLYFGTSQTTLSGPDGPPPMTKLYRLNTDGRTTLLWEGLKVANGIGLSPDGKRLYLNESWLGTYAYDLRSDGSLTNRTLLSNRADCDGLAVDQEGGVWIACFETGAILRVLPDGTKQELSVPARNVTSLCFGGADGRDLFVATGDDNLEALMQGRLPPKSASLFRARCEVAGLEVPRTHFTL
jgi:sugar lactone lactonase YvrE